VLSFSVAQHTVNRFRKEIIVGFDDSYLDEFEYYEDLFDTSTRDRRARRQRKATVRHKPKKPRDQIIAQLVDDTAGLEGGFDTTYQPSRYEEGWLLSSLRTFYDRGLINDVLSLVKGGKEASVYRCQADPATGATLLAAKVYRPTKFRNMRNDSVYRRGRMLLDANGHDHDYARDQRVLRAVRKKTAFGRQVRHTSWLMHEYTALQQLHQAGAAVPQPVAAGENAILMSYRGTAQMAAPTLNRVRLTQDEAQPIFHKVLQNVALLLQQRLIHGDLSAYNILYYEGKITVIDFPQVTNLDTNENACFILQRDIFRVCEYFSRQGVQCDPAAIVGELWYLYGHGDI
jgi:RIO kinase 1